MYTLAKFQPGMPKSFKATALQSSNNRKIDLCSKYRKNKLQVLTKTAVVYKCKELQFAPLCLP